MSTHDLSDDMLAYYEQRIARELPDGRELLSVSVVSLADMLAELRQRRAEAVKPLAALIAEVLSEGNAHVQCKRCYAEGYVTCECLKDEP